MRRSARRGGPTRRGRPRPRRRQAREGRPWRRSPLRPRLRSRAPTDQLADDFERADSFPEPTRAVSRIRMRRMPTSSAGRSGPPGPATATLSPRPRAGVRPGGPAQRRPSRGEHGPESPAGRPAPQALRGGDDRVGPGLVEGVEAGGVADAGIDPDAKPQGRGASEEVEVGRPAADRVEVREVKFFEPQDVVKRRRQPERVSPRWSTLSTGR